MHCSDLKNMIFPVKVKVHIHCIQIRIPCIYPSLTWFNLNNLPFKLSQRKWNFIWCTSYLALIAVLILLISKKLPKWTCKQTLLFAIIHLIFFFFFSFCHFLEHSLITVFFSLQLLWKSFSAEFQISQDVRTYWEGERLWLAFHMTWWNLFEPY